jgi:hypothetical protein
MDDCTDKPTTGLDDGVEPPVAEGALSHVAAIKRLLGSGSRAEAHARHNQRVDAELWRAHQGELINLSDLLAAKDELEFEDLSQSDP